MRITANEALNRLQGTGMLRRAKGKPLTLLRPVTYRRRPMVYLFGNGGGMTVSPAESDLPPVLGEMESVGGDIPPALEGWLWGYAQQIAKYQEGSISTAPVPTSSSPVSVSPLLKTNWNQGSPYNDHCTFDGDSCRAGCVAIAIGQLLYYWAGKGYRRGCTETAAYTSKTKKYNVGSLPPMSVFDFANIALTKPTTTVQKEAVATLIEYCGRATKMDYAPTGSGTNDYFNELTTKFRLCDGQKWVKAASGEEAYQAAVLDELRNGRPVLMYGANASNTGAHSFLCDGYRASDDKFHFNWGWGHYDGWFVMTALSKGTVFNFSYKRMSVVGIQPTYILGDVNGDGRINMSDVTKVINTANKGVNDPQCDVNYDGKVDEQDTQQIIDTILGKKQ